jgi:hypothetical protein
LPEYVNAMAAKVELITAIAMARCDPHPASLDLDRAQTRNACWHGVRVLASVYLFIRVVCTITRSASRVVPVSGQGRISGLMRRLVKDFQNVKWRARSNELIRVGKPPALPVVI